METTEKLIKLSNELIEKKKALQEEMKTVFRESVQDFFNKFPEVGMICWNQYTPYFNDGEPCIFSVNEVYFVPKTDSNGVENDLTQSPYEYDKCCFVERGSYAANQKYSGKAYYENIEIASEDLTKEMDNISTFINQNDDLMLDLFNDHVTVRLLPEEIIVEEYDHD